MNRLAEQFYFEQWIILLRADTSQKQIASSGINSRKPQLVAITVSPQAVHVSMKYFLGKLAVLHFFEEPVIGRTKD